jgi:ribosomal protein L11 methyltransferase
VRRRSAHSRAGHAWSELRVVTSPAAVEAVSAILWGLGVPGVAEDRVSGDAVRVRGYLPPSRVGASLLRSLRARVRGLAECGLDPGRASVSSRVVEAQRWASAWRSAARPVRIGRLVVAPTRLRLAPRRGQIIIRIDPGMAFGSGAHPSTRLALRALLRSLRMPRGRPLVVDVGTGSGILAIAAARLGARRVWARDTDPIAVAVARENVLANRVADRVRVIRGAGVGSFPARGDVIVANIIAETIADLLPEVRARIAPGGAFIGSGIVEDRLRGVLAAAAAGGFKLAEVLASGEWRAVVWAAPGGGRGVSARRGRERSGRCV